jgi:hypothetical protein
VRREIGKTGISDDRHAACVERSETWHDLAEKPRDCAPNGLSQYFAVGQNYSAELSQLAQSPATQGFSAKEEVRHFGLRVI